MGGGVDSFAASALIAIVSAVAGFAVSYVLKVRDERRHGGAAEGLLLSDLNRALDALETGGDTKPLRVPAWDTQWDRLATRFDPLILERLDGTIQALRYLEEELKEEGEPLALQSADPEKADLRAVIAILKERRARWVRWRPWVGQALSREERRSPHRATAKGRQEERRRRTGVATAEILVAGAVIAALVLGARELGDDASDPISTRTVEAELLQMAPDASMVNCTGDDAEDSWSCVVASGGCQIAQADPAPCTPSVLRNDYFDVRGDETAKTVYAQRRSRARARAKPFPDVDTEPASSSSRWKWSWGWIGRIGRPDPPARQMSTASPKATG
jgi:hypothetical protein